MYVIDKGGLSELLRTLRAERYTVVGPTLRDGAIVYDELTEVTDLPEGWTDTQDGGRYQVHRREDRALFGYAVGPQSWKQFLHPSRIRLWHAERHGDGFHVKSEVAKVPRFAFIGVRACELHAIAIQDKVFLGGHHGDPIYQTRREHIFVVAVNCGEPAGTCFCVSMETGPKARSGFDLALTEVVDAGKHYFTVEVGSARGQQLLSRLPHREASADEQRAASAVTMQAETRMGRSLNTADIKTLLYSNYEHPRWDEVAGRCLTCGNCTMVCPTCFCTTVEDVTDITGNQAERWRTWDSCFSMDFSYIHGGSVRASGKSRYRQWMTHKLATWIDQFGTSGCVGCGRCITWCPVGIDITAEVQAIRTTSAPRSTARKEDDDANA